MAHRCSRVRRYWGVQVTSPKSAHCIVSSTRVLGQMPDPGDTSNQVQLVTVTPKYNEKK